MYILIRQGMASKFELDNCYTLEQALKLYALWKMGQDIESAQVAEMQAKNNN